MAKMGQIEGADKLEAECLNAEMDFPNLQSEGYRKTSEADPHYNCIAHAAGKINEKWWPTDDEGYFWPLPDKDDDSLAAFISVFEMEGFSPCDGPVIEDGYEKSLSTLMHATSRNMPLFN
jgi:hypothetical protein